jgi:AraC family transcriptional regulator, transcriptional activator of the genes for pyochelin and ferripyochelin receptors
MEFNIIAPGANEIKLVNRLPSSFKGLKLSGAQSISASAHFGKMIFQNFKGEGFDIWYSNYIIVRNTQIIGRADNPLFELHVQFENQFYNEWDGFAKTLLRPYQYNITYAPHINNRVNFIGGQSYHTFDIHFSLAFLQRFARGSSILNEFLENVERRQPANISEIDRFLTPEMISIVNEILKRDFSDGLNYFFIESQVLRFLTLVLDQVAGKHPLSPLTLSDYEIENLHEAKRIILSDLGETITLSQLSRMVALNEYKLKKGFKYLFGTTIFECRRCAKMDQAKILLLETNNLVDDIAYILGFSHPSNFRKAFKKHFQFTPAELKKFTDKSK